MYLLCLVLSHGFEPTRLELPGRGQQQQEAQPAQGRGVCHWDLPVALPV